MVNQVVEVFLFFPLYFTLIQQSNRVNSVAASYNDYGFMYSAIILSYSSSLLSSANLAITGSVIFT